MPPLLTTLFRGLTFALGFILVYIAVFTYESTDKRIQNTLEDLWLALAYDSRTAGAVAKRFLWTVLNLMDRAFERVFGQNTISFRSFSAAFCYAYAAIPLSFVAVYLYAALAGLDLEPRLKTFPKMGQPREQIALGLTVIAIGALPALHASLRWLTLIIAFGILTSIAAATLAVATHQPEPSALFGSNAGEIVAASWILLAYGIVAVYIIRCAVRVIVNRKLTRRHLVFVASLLALPVFTFCLLASMTLIVGHSSRSPLIVLIAHLFSWPVSSFLLSYVGGPSSVWGMAIFVGFAFLLLVLLHLAMWPVIRVLLMKGLYAAQRHQVIRQKAKLVSIGLSTMACAIAPGPISTLWGRIVSQFRHLFA